jgi:hypothetical protein
MRKRPKRENYKTELMSNVMRFHTRFGWLYRQQLDCSFLRLTHTFCGTAIEIQHEISIKGEHYGHKQASYRDRVAMKY